MLAFTPAVESALRWFDATHELDRQDGRLTWRPKSLPTAGSVGEQDAALLTALRLLKNIHDDLVGPRTTRTVTDG